MRLRSPVVPRAQCERRSEASLCWTTTMTTALLVMDSPPRAPLLRHKLLRNSMHDNLCSFMLLPWGTKPMPGPSPLLVNGCRHGGEGERKSAYLRRGLPSMQLPDLLHSRHQRLQLHERTTSMLVVTRPSHPVPRESSFPMSAHALRAQLLTSVMNCSL